MFFFVFLNSAPQLWTFQYPLDNLVCSGWWCFTLLVRLEKISFICFTLDFTNSQFLNGIASCCRTVPVSRLLVHCHLESEKLLSRCYRGIRRRYLLYFRPGSGAMRQQRFLETSMCMIFSSCIHGGSVVLISIPWTAETLYLQTVLNIQEDESDCSISKIQSNSVWEVYHRVVGKIFFCLLHNPPPAHTRTVSNRSNHVAS